MFTLLSQTREMFVSGQTYLDVHCHLDFLSSIFITLITLLYIHTEGIGKK